MVFAFGLRIGSTRFLQLQEFEVCWLIGLGLKLALLVFLAIREVKTAGWRQMLFRRTVWILKDWFMGWKGFLFHLAMLVLETWLMGDQ